MAKNGELTARRQRFVNEYLIDFNGSRAAVAAGYSAKTAYSIANELLSFPEVQAAIAAGRAEITEKTEITQEEVRLELIAIAQADPRDLIDLRIVPCRCCHGRDGLPQETPPERHARYGAWDMATKLAKVRAKDKAALAAIPDFDELGGPEFYDERKDVNPDCRSCFGRGEERVRPKDQSKLSPGAVKLLKGIKVKADGSMEILTHDKTKALELLGRHLAMFTDKNVSVSLNLNAELPADPVEAARAYARLMG